MAGPQQKECPSCGAPLPVNRGATSVKCQYCGAAVEVERTRAPPPEDPARPPTVYVSPGLPRAAVIAIVMTALLPIGITTLTMFGSTITGAITSHTITFPMTCGNNDDVQIVGRTYAGSGTLITAGLNCKLHIKDSKLSGDVVVVGKQSNDITIENSTLEGKDAAIRLEMNGHVHATNGSVLRGTNAAIGGGINTTIELEDGRVEGGDDGITGDLNTEIHATRTTISGHDAAIALENNGHVFGDVLTLTGNVIGIEAETNLEVAVEQSTITGGETGVKGAANLHARLSKKSRITGKTVGIDAGNNLELTLDDSVVDSDDIGALTEWNPHLKLVHGARLRGGKVGLDAGENLEALLQQGTIESAGTALCGKNNARIEARNASISGTPALHFEREPELRLVETAVIGTRLFDGKGCDAPSPRPDMAGPAAARRSKSAAPPPAPVQPRPPGAPPPTGPSFDGAAAVIALDAATRAANAQCRSSSGKPEKAFVTPGFSPDGRNTGAQVDDGLRNLPEGRCVEGIFRNVRIPPFDPTIRPSGLVRSVDLN